MKKGTRLLSVLLSALLVFSALGAAFTAAATDAYKPTYTDKVTEQDVEALLDDINTLLSREVLNGAAIEEIYKLLPTLSSIVNNGGQQYSTRRASYFAEAYPERFAKLADYTADEDGTIVDDVKDEQGNVTTPGTFTKFFQENPIVCEDLAAFQAELGEIIDMVVINNVLSTITFAFAFFANDKIPAGQALCDGVDQLCDVLGAKQEKPLKDLIGLGAQLMQYDTEGTRAYLKNLVAALLPDLSGNAMGLVRSLADEKDGAALYAGVSAVLNNLSDVVTALSSSLAGLMDISSVVASINDLKTQFAALPTTGEGETLRLDLEGVVSKLVPALTKELVTLELKVTFVDRAENGTNPPATPGTPDLGGFLSSGLQLRHMKLERVSGCAADADVLKTVYDYLYDNLIADPTNNALLSLVPSLNVLPEDVAAFLEKGVKLDNASLADELIRLVAKTVGRHIVTLVPAVHETCIAAGSKAYYVCDLCGKWFADAAATAEIVDKDSVVIPASADSHDLAEFAEVPATCTEDGRRAHFACVLCGKVFADAAGAEELTEEALVIPAAGHTLAEHYYADPSGHALICETCGVTVEAGSHADADGDGKCDVCAYTMPNEQPADPDNPADPDKPADPAAGEQDETPVKDTDIPKTGAAGLSLGALSLAAAAAFVLLRKTKKA